MLAAEMAEQIGTTEARELAIEIAKTKDSAAASPLWDRLLTLEYEDAS